MNTNSKIFVAGHRGLLGSAVVRKLRADGYKNLLLKTRSELNLFNSEAVNSFFEKEKPEYVFLCAARVGGIQANMDSPVEFLTENLSIQNNVMSAAAKYNCKKLLFVGSSCIYPMNAPVPIKEESLLSGPFEATNEGYALAKVAGLRLCQYFRKEYGKDFISAMPTNLYGINDHYDLRKSHFLPALLLKVHTAKEENSKRLELWGTGKPRREFMLSDDCADALVFLMKNYSDTGAINIGMGEDFAIADFAKEVCKALDYPMEFYFNTSKPDGMHRKLLDTTRLTQLGWKPKYSLQEGIKIAYADFLQQREVKRAA